MVTWIEQQLDQLSRENARLLQRLADSERRFRVISQGVLRVQEAERGRISRELHDGVGQALTGLKLQLDVLEREAAAGASPLIARLGELKELTERTLNDVRALSHLLRPQMLDDLGLAPTLRWLTRTFEARARVPVTFEHEGLRERLDPDVEIIVFRVTQEALNNVAKYAEASHVHVGVTCGEARLTLSIEDDGTGFDAGAALRATGEDQGCGVRGMRDRVQLFGGTFALNSVPGHGTRIDVELSLTHADKSGASDTSREQGVVPDES
ncbi:MAG: sensor histidine kinase [Luteitalea sp.]|nr:sensor histidine kinase [Luteitalea sp.]